MNDPADIKILRREHQLRHLAARAGDATIGAVVIYLIVCYGLLPLLWRHYEHHQGMSDAPKTTVTTDGLPGDPLNVALVATHEEIVAAMLAAKWSPADATNVRSSLHIAESVVLDRNYETAPVSNLFVWGRKQDLAFEQAVDENARERHHVRFWRSDKLGIGDRPLWLGAATFDRSVGFSHFTGKITHHIAADIDSERDHVIETLSKAGQLTELFQVTGVGATLDGRNGGGDRYFTDGEITIGLISPANKVQSAPPKVRLNPAFIQAKDDALAALRPLMK